MTAVIRFAICDDEPFMAEELSGRLAAFMAERAPYSVRRFSSGQALLESSCDFDLIFLDIQMAPPDGMETAKALRRRKNRSLLIFVTVLGECVFDAFEVQAYDYLLKPLDDRRFFRCHRSYLVNLDFVGGYGAGRAALLQGMEIPVSRLRERDLTQALLRRMKEREA